NVDGALWHINSGTVTEPTVQTNGKITQIFRQGDITVTRTYQLADSTSGNADMLRIGTTVQNTGAVSHVVGLMVGIDTMIGANDGAPLFTNEGIIYQEAEYSGALVPTSWQA